MVVQGNSCLPSIPFRLFDNSGFEVIENYMRGEICIGLLYVAQNAKENMMREMKIIFAILLSLVLLGCPPRPPKIPILVPPGAPAPPAPPGHKIIRPGN
jgi:hypothetical protein